MVKKSRKLKKQRSLFNPDVIKTEIHQAIRRDFSEAQHVYCLNDDLTLHAFNRQVQDFDKKYCATDQDVDLLTTQTFEKFFEVNEHIGKVNEKLKQSLPSPDLHVSRTNTKMEKIHLRARALMHSVLGSFSVSDWFTQCRNSGGSTIGVPYRDTSVESKFTFPISMTKEVKTTFECCMTQDRQVWAAVKEFNDLGPISDPYKLVGGSRATTVDKTTAKRRMICIEPTANMYLQQGLMLEMYSKMKAVGLDVERLPDLHKLKAQLSSISCREATIDWSSASDCLAFELIRWLTPPKWFDALNMTRSKVASFPGRPDVELNMFSTMGNAVTFPLETLVFWTYAHAVILTERNDTSSLYPEWEELGKVSVFGDDCIVPTPIAPQYMEAMVEVGFIVNKEKSFYGTEQFRESCGGDYLCGFDVRPYTIKAPTNTVKSALEPWLYIIANSLLKKYVVYFGKLSYVYDKELWRVLFDVFERNKIKIKLVPSYLPDDAGLKLSHDILRFHNHYQFTLSTVESNQHGTASFLYCRYVYRASKERDAGIRMALWFKQPFQDRAPKIRHTVAVREKGGYVVAKGISCHWHVPDLNYLAG